ncbi:unnamed protein product [Clonostachys byssicola]|uniref:Zn(2)-C6 fungal-type domain-containing protein n=1 Tax=Clonostachys byssicola TaxID=160290 RepID=A0A9N9U0C3_9HYPO|nr:unnamed protein product [Clonostachys byssicola]
MSLSPSAANAVIDGEKPSCQECRRRKQKCSRDDPACSYCLRQNIPCVYDAKKNKPGLKVGAVEALSKRVEVLEQSFHDREQQEKALRNTGHGRLSENTAQLIGAVTALVSEIQGITSKRSQRDVSAPINSVTPQVAGDHDAVEQSHPPKRRRLSNYQCVSPASSRSQPRLDLSDDQITHDLIDEAVHLYFAKVFYWIPLIHRSRFKDQIRLVEGRRRLSVVIDAILIATLRFVDRHKHSLSEEDITRLTTEKRKSVLIAAMDNLNIENLQALVILAFTDIGHGTPNRSWSIIGSMTRTAEYLQLTTEESQRNKTSTRRLSPLPTTDDWVEQEERRRIFWNIFNLDRYFSVTTGWDAIIDTSKINLKLPANGSYWYAEEPVGCPYFNIGGRPGVEKMDKSSAHTSDRSRPDIPVDAGSPVLSSESSGGSWLGGFAYCIEASEYLRRISTFVLHQDVNFANQKDVRAWLTRFKELDLQLVHWKMFLPRKWSDPNRAPNTSTGPRDLDHNMTLAHVTHNTSMILLHHRIAYPPAGWCHNVPLPSACSAETCRLAATKTSNIMEKWLSICPEEIIVAPQMALCTFISARLLILHWLNNNKKLDSEFWVLVRSLEHMSRRWEGPRTGRAELPPNLAGKYAINLRNLYEKCIAQPSFEVNLIDYQDDLFCSGASYTSNDILDRDRRRAHNLGISDVESSHAAPLVPSNIGSTSFDNATGQLVSSAHLRDASSGQAPSSSTIQLPLPTPSTHESTHITAGNGSSYSINAASPYPPEDLMEISQALMDQRFSEMDRIITLDDSFFEAAALAPNMPLLPISEWSGEDMNGQYYPNGGRSM